MAQATVQLKVTPHELQIIREALRQYANQMQKFGKETFTDLPIDLSICSGDYLTGARDANKLIRDIGLS